jgi:D-3-phosphoglycerate dehydrogenase
MNILLIDSSLVNYVDGTISDKFQAVNDCAITISTRPTDVQLARANGVVAFHTVKVDQSLISKLKTCKALVKATRGIDDVDLAALSKNNIKCANIGDAGINEVADHTLAFMLHFQRKLQNYSSHTLSGGWRWRLPIPVQSCRSMVLGLIGYGATARAVAKRAIAFGYQIKYYDAMVEQCSLKIASKCTLEELVATSDILSIHIPFDESSHHLFNDGLFSNVKMGACIINTARGGIVNTASLLNALDNGRISQAYLDVVDEEPNIPAELIAHPAVMLTPHAAFYSENSLSQLTTAAISTVINLLNGKKVDTLLN